MHESKPAFEALLARHLHAHAPATPAEELLVFRIAQKAWLLRRLETWERVIADSRIAKVRQQHANAAAPACIALGLLEARETEETRFHQRAAALRKEHEAAQDRLESKLSAAQQRREARERQDVAEAARHRVSLVQSFAMPARVRHHSPLGCVPIDSQVEPGGYPA